MDAAYSMLDESRPRLLKHLREIGVSALKDRQALCNALARARRLKALAIERAAQAEAGVVQQRWTIKVDGRRVDYVPVPGGDVT